MRHYRERHSAEIKNFKAIALPLINIQHFQQFIYGDRRLHFLYPQRVRRPVDAQHQEGKVVLDPGVRDYLLRAVRQPTDYCNRLTKRNCKPSSSSVTSSISKMPT